MTVLNPIKLVGGLNDTNNVPKGDIVSWALARLAQTMDDPNEVNNTKLAGQKIIYVVSLNKFFKLDTSDTTSTDNGSTCLLSGDTSPARYKIVNSREQLTADRTYYVRTDGSDSNDGLTNTSGGAFLTIQKALACVFGTLDIRGYNVTIQVGSGTYTGPFIILYPQVGAGIIKLQGDTTTPSNCVLSSTSAGHLLQVYGGILNIAGFKMTTAGTQPGSCIQARFNGQCNIVGNMEFGACAQAHISVAYGASVQISSNYSITGNALYHMQSNLRGGIIANNITVTVTGTPAFSTAFAAVDFLGLADVAGSTFSGSATGTRYTAADNAIIRTAGGGASFFPGNASGSTSSGGLYI